MRCPVGGSRRQFGDARRAHAGAQADRPAASLLLSRDVLAAADQRPEQPAWSPDSSEADLFHGRSLWRQKIGTGIAQQLTAAAAYDYQPDWSPDGRWVIYSSYRDDALELWILDLRTGATQALTKNGAVNVEPRFSPGRQAHRIHLDAVQQALPYFHGRFRQTASCLHVERLTGEHKSDLPRYYYSAYDHEINPVWTRDGREIIYVSNRGHIYGTGGFWRIARVRGRPPQGDAAPSIDGREFHYEETNWKARPDVSPDGSRLVYSSYLGRVMAQSVAHAGGRRGCVPHRLRRLGYDLSALVAGRHADRLHLEQERQHGNRGDREIPGGLAADAGRRPRAAT